MERLLCIVGGMNAGGAETYLMKLFRQLDKRYYQMDFCVMIQEEGYYDKEIEKLGGKIYHVLPKTKNPMKSFLSIRKIVCKGQYKSVLRISQNSLSCLELCAAKLGGAKKLCFRSSNSNTCGNTFEDIVHVIFKPWLNLVTNVKIAPSTEAGTFMFGRRQISKHNVYFLHNAIDTKIFTYKENMREKYRDRLGVEGKYVIGHIGRFTKQKNHKYLLKVFLEVQKRKENTILFLIGDGELLEDIKEEVFCLGLEKNVLFFGLRQDIVELMNAMDLLVLPSLYEGMPNVLIEAQATGLPCIASNTITKEADITGLVQYISLNNPKRWVENIEKNIEKGNEGRKNRESQFKEKGYDIENVCHVFEKLVFIR